MKIFIRQASEEAKAEKGKVIIVRYERQSPVKIVCDPDFVKALFLKYSGNQTDYGYKIATI